MTNPFKALDRILRGEATRLPLLQTGRFEIPVAGLLFVIILLGAIYGACMALPTVMARWHSPVVSFQGGSYQTSRMEGFEQLGASMVKVPLLFLLTLLVTFPSLYVFSALLGSRLTLGSLLKLLMASVSVMVALLAAFGPIVAFFALSTDSYPFMKLLNVAVFAVAGFMGLAFLLQTLQRLTVIPLEVTTPPANGEPQVKTIFRIWIVLFGLVGAQMGWVLRPFIGDPHRPFEFFRARESNFFEGLAHTISHLINGS